MHRCLRMQQVSGSDQQIDTDDKGNPTMAATLCGSTGRDDTALGLFRQTDNKVCKEKRK